MVVCGMPSSQRRAKGFVSVNDCYKFKWRWQEMNVKILYQKYTQTLWNKGQLNQNLRSNKLRSKFDKCELLFAVLLFSVNCIKEK
jgi:hypothetical protein